MTFSFLTVYAYTECRYAEFRYAECHYAECCYAECRYAKCCDTVKSRPIKHFNYNKIYQGVKVSMIVFVKKYPP